MAKAKLAEQNQDPAVLETKHVLLCSPNKNQEADVSYDHHTVSSHMQNDLLNKSRLAPAQHCFLNDTN